MIIDRYSEIYKDDKTLRPYQQKAKKEIFEAWDEVDSVMFQMPTGTGKTKLFTSIIRDINDYSLKRREAVKILIIAHRTELIKQIDKSLDRYQVPHNIIAGGKKKNYKFPVNIASIQTITHPNNMKDAKTLNVQFVIIDEAHHALATSYRKLWRLYPEAKRLGVTATPWRMNHQSFKRIFDKLVLSMPIKDFIKQGYLAPYKYYSLKNDSDIQKTIDKIELDKFGEYKESSMEERMDIGSIRAQLLDSYLSLAEGKKGIIYAINIAHANHICEEYKKAGYKAASIDSKTPAKLRDGLVEKFQKSEIDIIVNVDIFSEGFDCPDIEFIQLARPTRSLVKYLQQVGRGLRITSNKQNCIILDNVGMYSRFGLPDARRHWRQHFLGRKVDEEPKRYMSTGGGRPRYVDLSEGCEDMELIQDVEDDVEIIEEDKNLMDEKSTIADASSSGSDLCNLFGITLGKTTWKEAESMGHTVKIWKEGPGRYMDIGKVTVWDHEGKGVFTTCYWSKYDSDFPPSWKANGFSWNLSYDEWVGLLKGLGYTIKVIRQVRKKKYSGYDTLDGLFEALSPDGKLSISFSFAYGEKGSTTSSHETLFMLSVRFEGFVTLPQDDRLPCNFNDFFPIYGVTLGKTTWRQVEEMGYKVEKSKDNSSRNTTIEKAYICDLNGKGVFNWMLLLQYNTIPPLWKSKGFSWNLSYEEWVALFNKMGFDIKVTKQPTQIESSGRMYLSAEFEALTSDRNLLFKMEFGYGYDGYYTSSPKTLFSLSVLFNGETFSEVFIYSKDGKTITGTQGVVKGYIIIPEGVEGIAEEVFMNNTEITGVSLPNSLRDIGASAFSGCKGIKSISLNSGLKTIGYDAFRGTGLSQVKIPASTVSIGCSAFSCKMKVDKSSVQYIDKDGVLYSSDKKELVIYPSRKREEMYAVHEGVEEIRSFAFEDSSLHSIALPGTVWRLDNNIFSGCKKLTSLTCHVKDPQRLVIKEPVFDGFEKGNCKLIVPYGCRERYLSREYFNGFLSVEELAEEHVEDDSFDPSPILDANNFETDNFIFWFKDTKKIYESYIQDDTYFIISELMVDDAKHCVHRKRVGKIPMESWMFWQMNREKVDNLKSITHYGANYTVFHYKVQQSDKTIKDKYFDYKGREIEKPAVVEFRFKNTPSNLLKDYIDVPVSKATFAANLQSNQITIYRTIKGKTNPIAVFSLNSDFGKNYQTKNAILKNAGSKYGKAAIYELPQSLQIYRSDEKSFTVRCTENEVEYLKKYDFNGKLTNKGTIAVAEDTTASALSESDTDKLRHVFDSKATTYKFFWFLSIVQLYKENKEPSILYKRILARMISNAWRYVRIEELDFPKADQLPNYIDDIQARFMLDDFDDMEKIEGQILYYYERAHLDRFLSPLLKNVPYRFLSPWIPFTSNYNVTIKSNDEKVNCIYSLHDDHIRINPMWRDYLLKNYAKIERFIEKELDSYLNR